MKVLILGNSPQDKKHKLEQQVQKHLPGVDIRCVTSVNDIVEALCRPMHGVSVVTAFIDDDDELEELLRYKNIMESVRLILVLRDTKAWTAALQLRPSYITDWGSDMRGVCGVLERIRSQATA